MSLKLIGYRQFLEPTILEFPDGLCGICGPNGVGKSKLIEAIGYALYGTASPVLPKGDKKTDLPSRGSMKHAAAASVELLLEVRGQRYRIVRSRQRATVHIDGTAEPLSEGSRAVTTKVIELLRLPPAAFYGTFVARQKDVAGLQTLQRDERKRLVNRLIGIEQVEYALKLAGEERKTRGQLVEVVQARQGRSSEAACMERDTITQQLAHARADEATCESAKAQAQAAYEAALAAVSVLQEQIKGLEEQQRVRDALVQDLAARASTLATAQNRLELATAAAKEVEAARAILRQTADAPTQLELWDRLATIDALRQKQAALNSRLQRQISPQLAIRDQALRALTEVEAQVEALRLRIGAREQEGVRADQQRRQAKRQRERAQQRIETARDLGPEGACETCGQIFGNGLDVALAHFTEERDAAQRDETYWAQEQASIQESQRALEHEMSLHEQARTERQQQLQESEDLPGERAAIQRDLQEIEHDLAAFAASELEHIYDVQAHVDVGAVNEARARAAADVARLETLSSAEQGIHDEVRDLEQQLATLTERRSQVEAVLAWAQTLPARLRRSQEHLRLVAAHRDHQDGQAREAAQLVARFIAQLEAAEQEVTRALAHEQETKAATYALQVAERTDELLQQLLREITQEARPRLRELLDGWARALLGPRFHQIELDDEYRILADNGSGMHLITHFSGGEQTLLAIMLRVAIALFCRERAGFDTSFLVLDEVFGDQDGEHRAQLVQFLGEVKEHYHQILVINHVEDVTDLLDYIIDVKPTGQNTSTIELRR